MNSKSSGQIRQGGLLQHSLGPGPKSCLTELKPKQDRACQAETLPDDTSGLRQTIITVSVLEIHGADTQRPQLESDFIGCRVISEASAAYYLVPPPGSGPH
eukprot:3852721-Rhodomonas_salina.3